MMAAPGEILLRFLEPKLGGGIEASAVIDAPPRRVYEIVTDYDRYRELIPSLADAKVIQWESKDVCILSEKLKIAFKTVEYSVRISHDRKKLTTSWTRHDGLLSRNDGGWKCEPHGKGRTLLTYRVAVDAGMLIPRFVVNHLTKGSLPDLFAAIRKRAVSEVPAPEPART